MSRLYVNCTRKGPDRPGNVKKNMHGGRVLSNYVTQSTDSRKTTYAKMFKIMQSFLYGSRSDFDAQSSGRETKSCRGLKGDAWHGDLERLCPKKFTPAH